MYKGQFETKPGFYPPQQTGGFNPGQPVHLPPPVYSAVNPPRSTLFNVAKYYIVIKNSIVFGVLSLVLLILSLGTLAALFSENPGIGFLLLLCDTMLGLAAFYYWKVPIKGALGEKPTHVIVHGVLVGINLLFSIGLLINLNNLDYSQIDERFRDSIRQALKPSNFVAGMVFSALEMLSCFHVAHVAKQTPKEQPLFA